MKNLLHRDSHRRIIRVDLHNVGHKVPPPPCNLTGCLRILRIEATLDLLIAKKYISVTIPKYGKAI